MRQINTKKRSNGNWYEYVVDDTAYYSKYEALPDLAAGGDDINVSPNSLFKYNGCIYQLERSGEITLCNTWDASGRLTIPKEIRLNGKAYPVTRIGHIDLCDYVYTDYHNDRRKKPDVYRGVLSFGAFFGSRVKECVFPTSIQEIEEIKWGPSKDVHAYISKDTFSGYSENSLSEISFSDDGPSELRSIGPYVFRYCYLDMGTLRLPEGLRQIGEQAFSGNFTNIICPSTLRKIDENAFFYCSVKSLKLNEGLEYLGPNFVDLYHFTEKLEIPSSVKVIPQLNWSMEKRWELIKKLPTLVIHNSKKDVDIDKTVKNTCLIHYIDSSGKKEKHGGIRNIVYKAHQPKSQRTSSGRYVSEYEDFNGWVTSRVGTICFLVFVAVLWTVLIILNNLGILK